MLNSFHVQCTFYFLQAKELKFYIPQMSLLSGTDTTGGAVANTAASASASASATTNAGIKVPDKRNIDISVEDKHRVFLHPSSVNFDNSVFKESNFLMYGERQLVTYTNNNTGNQESKIYLRDTTEASAFALLFFGGVLEVEYSDGIVTVDGWIRYAAICRCLFIQYVIYAQCWICWLYYCRMFASLNFFICAFLIHISLFLSGLPRPVASWRSSRRCGRPSTISCRTSSRTPLSTSAPRLWWSSPASCLI